MVLPKNDAHLKFVFKRELKFRCKQIKILIYHVRGEKSKATIPKCFGFHFRVIFGFISISVSQEIERIPLFLIFFINENFIGFRFIVIIGFLHLQVQSRHSSKFYPLPKVLWMSFPLQEDM